MTHAIQLAYLLATALFVFALHWMNDPKTARRGVFAGVAAMGLAIVATWIQPGVIHHGWIVLAIMIGVLALGAARLSAAPLAVRALAQRASTRRELATAPICRG